MANNKCGHQTCECPVSGNQRFCSDACRDLAAAKAEGRCGCDHPDCARESAK